jgi:thiol-disulfide isomerase/thioredoxin
LKYSLTRIIYLITILFVQGCVTNPPSEVEIITAKVIIKSNVGNAEIFLDNINTGKFTPDSIEVDQGSHTIRIEKEGYFSEEKNVIIENEEKVELNFVLDVMVAEKIVLLEDFANVSCDPCVISNTIIEQLSGEYENQLVVVKYSANFPSPNDPFYNGAREDNDYKMNFYNILFAPTVIIDGIERPISTDENSIKSAINKRIAEVTPFDIKITGSKTIDKYNLQSEVKLLDDNFDVTNCKLFLVVVEEEISFSNPPGSNGETVFFNVMRDVLPDNTGLNLSFTNDDKSMKNSFEVKLENEWNSENISGIIFIQNNVTKEVYQANKIEN